VTPVKIGPNTLGVVQNIFYDEKEKCITAEIILPFGFMGVINPTKDLMVGNRRRLIDGKLVGVRMIPEQMVVKEKEDGDKSDG